MASLTISAGWGNNKIHLDCSIGRWIRNDHYQTNPHTTTQALCSKRRLETTNWEIDNLIVKSRIHFFWVTFSFIRLAFFGYVSKVTVVCPNTCSILGRDKIARLYTSWPRRFSFNGIHLFTLGLCCCPNITVKERLHDASLCSLSAIMSKNTPLPQKFFFPPFFFWHLPCYFDDNWREDGLRLFVVAGS